MTTTTSRTLHRIRRRLTGLAATTVVAAIVFGLPVLLMVIGADLIPDQGLSPTGLTDALLAPDDGSLVLAVLTVVAWVAWAVMALSVTVEAIALIRRVDAPALPGLGRPQAAARGLLAAAALLFIAAPLVAPPAATPATAVVSHHTTNSTTQAPGLDADTAPAARPHTGDARSGEDRTGTAAAAAGVVVHTVRPGESLWGIAEQHLGDGARYGEIVELNRNLIGNRPSFLQVGWELHLPTPPAASTEQQPPASYTVAAGDTLSEIAHEQLGDADRYPEIFEASTGITQPGEARLADPDVIDVGWTLTIPTDHDNPAQQPPPPRRAGDPPPSSVDDPTPTGQEDPSDAGPTESESEPTTATPRATTPAGQPAPEEQGESAAEDTTTTPTTVDRGDEVGEGVDDSVLSAPWVLAGLSGAGVLLSGALLLALRGRRRAGFRNRPPARALAAPAPDLAPVEMTLNATGTTAAVTVEFTDEVLCRLAATVAGLGRVMPPVAAVELGTDRLTLHLSAPAQVPRPWVGSPDHTHWHIPVSLALDEVGPDTGTAEAPYPLLVTIGTTSTGETWLLNCEELATLTITGDSVRCRDFARHLAAQVAVNPWSRRVRLDCIGVADEVVAMDERIVHHPTGPDAQAATGEVLAAAVAMVERATRNDTDVSTGRTGGIDDDVWPARMLLVDAAAGVPADLPQLRQLVGDHVGRAATSIIVIADTPTTTPVADLLVTPAGRVVLEHAGLDLEAVGLTSEEARGCALVYAQAENPEYVPVPVDESATDGWEAYADYTGGLRAEHTLPRHTPNPDPAGGGGVSLLEGDDEDYLHASAAVAEDLDAVAPKVPAGVRADVENADPTLDRDVADWFATDCPHPRLTLLGAVHARTHGKALAKRRPYFTELLAFLALRRRTGVTVAEVSRTFGIKEDKARDYAQIVRDWLGVNPATGTKYLPNADQAPATTTTGVNVYQIHEDLLVDYDLLRRLHLRAKARGGTDGQHDLQTALKLITGLPFDGLREGGWNWLFDGERHDEYATYAIADIAFTMATCALAAGDLVTARSAAHTAATAAPHEEFTRLCLVKITEAEGHPHAATQMLREEVCNRTDDHDAPPELSARTKTIITTHDWLAS
ncbi:MAG: LysM peptidoglycan-binding domain-containing protein [Nocardioides sp.]